jgi:phosphomevalonate kinase
LADGAAPPAKELAACVHGTTSAWDHIVEPFHLPPGVEVMMADVACGANTPSMVKQVQKWRQSDPVAEALWQEYAAASAKVQGAIAALCKLHERGVGDRGWDAQLCECSAVQPTEWNSISPVGAALALIRQSGLELRQLILCVSAAAATPIEPPSQTALLNATMEVPGVLLAVVPGAGGGDAVLALVLPSAAPSAIDGPVGERGRAPCDIAATRSRVAALWAKWPSTAPPPAPTVVCELPVREAPATARHNGVLVEATSREQGVNASAGAKQLAAARENAISARENAISARAAPSSVNHLRSPSLRVFTPDELRERAAKQAGRAAWARAAVEALAVVAAVAAIVVIGFRRQSQRSYR